MFSTLFSFIAICCVVLIASQDNMSPDPISIVEDSELGTETFRTKLESGADFGLIIDYSKNLSWIYNGDAGECYASILKMEVFPRMGSLGYLLQQNEASMKFADLRWESDLSATPEMVIHDLHSSAPSMCQGRPVFIAGHHITESRVKRQVTRRPSSQSRFCSASCRRECARGRCSNYCAANCGMEGRRTRWSVGGGTDLRGGWNVGAKFTIRF